MGVQVKNLFKRFASAETSHAAVSGVNFEVSEGSLVALLGPSGSGKSTVLRLIAGLERPDRGEIFLNGESVTGIPVQDRGQYLAASGLEFVAVDAQLRKKFVTEVVFPFFCEVVEIRKDPLLHFLRRLVGKCNAENVPEVRRLAR